jgi:hypothetical protein
VALGQGAQFLGLFLMGCLTRWLEARARHLMGRLHAQPDLPDRVKTVERPTGHGVTTTADFRITAAG